jgi:hypothetical protein
VGELSISQPLLISTPAKEKAGAFARTCQATHLMGKAIRLLDDTQVDGPLRYSEGMQLLRTLQALAKLLMSEPTQSLDRLTTSRALIYGSLMQLGDTFCCGTSHYYNDSSTMAEIEMQSTAIITMQDAAKEVLAFSRIIQADLRLSPTAVSPFASTCIYYAAAIFAWLAYEKGTIELADAYHTLKRVLESMGIRWQVANEYLILLDKAKETLYADFPLI